MTRIMRIGRLLAGMACFAVLLGSASRAGAAADPTKYGIAELSASLSTTQAGAHPDFTTTVGLATDPEGKEGAGLLPTYARTKDLAVAVPPGVLGNPQNFSQCTTSELEEWACPIASQVGVTKVSVYEAGTLLEPVYLMTPAGSGVVSRLGFIPATNPPAILSLRVRPELDYGIEAAVENANAVGNLVSAETTLWGIPADPSHDSERITPLEVHENKVPPGGARASDASPVPFMTNPTRCNVQRQITASADSYKLPGAVVTSSAPFPAITGCGKLIFSPAVSFAPTTASADSPSGIDADVTLPQQGLREQGPLATPHLKRAVVALPAGMTLNPSSAQGLGACSEAEVGLVSEAALRFDGAAARCPASSKVGTAEIDTPVLAGPISGSLYLAEQRRNPFHSLLAGYLVAEGEGVTVKLAGRFDLDASGRITAVFDQNPEQPFEHLRLHFKGGARGVLTTPPRCGSFSIESSLTAWSAVDPNAPTAAESSVATSPFSLTSGPEGRACPGGSFAPTLTAGTTDATAGAFSPFVLRLAREDGTQRLERLELTMPRGLIGKLAGIPYCPEQAIQRLASMTAEGDGSVELGAPSCAAGSHIGTVAASLGSGPSPLYVSTGQVYLAGPYEGAPLSLLVAAPALAGPFDLGNVIVRASLHVDPESAQISAVSDPLPANLDGVPLDLREIRMVLGRDNFILNPTSCRPEAFEGRAISTEGVSASLSEPFQAASCTDLGFKPRLSLALKGGARRTAHPALHAVLEGRKGDANISHAVVALPRSEFIDQARISNPCTRVQFAAAACPKGSILGKAKVFTSLLDEPLEGPVIFRSNGGERLLPDIVLDLHGQVHLVQVGFIHSAKGRLQTTFASVPDAPFTKLVLDLKGGKQGLLQNSENLCAGKRHAGVALTAQNGRARNFNTTIHTSCGKRSAHPRRGR